MNVNPAAHALLLDRLAHIGAGRTGRVRAPVTVVPTSGDTLRVNFRLTADGAEDVTLFGPALHVFRGELAYGAP